MQTTKGKKIKVWHSQAQLSFPPKSIQDLLLVDVLDSLLIPPTLPHLWLSALCFLFRDYSKVHVLLRSRENSLLQISAVIRFELMYSSESLSGEGDASKPLEECPSHHHPRQRAHTLWLCLRTNLGAPFSLLKCPQCPAIGTSFTQALL